MRCPSLWAGGSCVVRGAMVCGEAAGGGAEAPRTDRGAAAFPPRAASWGGHCVRNRSARGMRARQTRCGCTAGAMRARACPRGAGPRGRRMRGRAPARRGRGSRGPSAAHPRQRRRPSRPCHLSCGICAHAQPWGHGGGARSAWGRRPVVARAPPIHHPGMSPVRADAARCAQCALAGGDSLRRLHRSRACMHAPSSCFPAAPGGEADQGLWALRALQWPPVRTAPRMLCGHVQTAELVSITYARSHVSWRCWGAPRRVDNVRRVQRQHVAGARRHVSRFEAARNGERTQRRNGWGTRGVQKGRTGQ